MKRPVIIVTVFFFTTGGYSQSNSPSVINTAGGSYRSGYNQFEWSIGELALIGQMSNSNNSIIITNGFIQPYILHPGASNPDYIFNKDEIKVFPNPATDYIEINFFSEQRGRVTLTIYDAAGKSVYTETIQYNGVDLIKRIPVKNFSASVYMLHINLEASEGYVSKKGAYKIIKIQ